MSQKKIRTARATCLIPYDPCRPPPPLVERVEGKPGECFNFREGGRMQLCGRASYPPDVLFKLVLIGSAILDGQPIRCSSFVSGVSLGMTVGSHPSAHEISPDRYAQQVWQCVQPVFDDWLANPDAQRIPGITMKVEKGDVTVRFARDELLQLRPGVMQIEVQD